MKQTVIIASSRLQTRLLQSVRLLIWLACLSLAQPFAALAQTDVPAPLPPAAQEAFDKGIMAAREQGYLVAIRYLQEARKLAPQAPQIFRSLGAVEAKIPSRELRAVAWYGAYLAAFPQASDAAEVSNEIARLEVKNQINISRLINQVQETAAAAPIPDRGDYYYNNARWGNRMQVAVLWAEAGDITSALNTVKLLDDEIMRSAALSQIAEVQAKAGDIAGAFTSAGLITRLNFKSKALLRIGKIQTAAGDFAGAQKTLTLAVGASPDYEDLNMSAIAEAQAEAGDIAGARKTVTFIKNDDSELNPVEKSSPQLAIARAQAKAGDLAGALQTADLIQQIMYKAYARADIAVAQLKAGDFAGALMSANLIHDANLKSKAQLDIAGAQARNGDLAGAQNTLADARKSADSIHDLQRKQRLIDIAEAQAKSGDHAGAQKTADLIKDEQYNRWAQKAIADALAKADIPKAPDSTRQITPDPQPPIKPSITVSDWLKKLDDGNKDYYSALNTEPFLDLAGYLKSLPSSDSPQKVFDSLHETAMKIIGAQNVITGMLKQQSGK